MSLPLFPCTGAIAWMSKLKWPGLADFKTAKRTPVYPDTYPSKKRTGAFYQAYKNLAFYWILNAGHMVSGCMCVCLGVEWWGA